MALDDVLKVDVHFTLQGNPNVYCFNYVVSISSGIPGQDEVDLNAVFNTDIIPGIRLWSDETVVFHCLVTSLVKRGDPDDDTVFAPKVFDLANVLGLRSVQEALPGQCSAVVQTFKSLEDAGPRLRGRDFITGLVEADQADGEWSQATADLVLNVYETAIIGDLAGGAGATYTYGNYSATQEAENNDPQFVSNGGAVPDPPTFGNNPFNDVTIVRMVESVRTQRRRQHEDACAILLLNET